MSTCEKRRWRRQRAADAALDSIRQQEPRDGVKKPVRSYLCPDCDGYHLTSRGAPSTTCSPCQFDVHNYCEGDCACSHGGTP